MSDEFLQQQLRSETLGQPNRNLYFHWAIYSVWIASASLLGGWLPRRIRLSHVRFQLLLSFVGGLMLGIGLLHLLPHAVFYLGIRRIDEVVLAMLGGILVMFFLLRAFHVHHHEPEPAAPTKIESLQPLPLASTQPLGPAGHHHHGTEDHGHCQHDHQPRGKLGWLGLLVGLSIHTVLDGVALGAAMRADAVLPGFMLLGAGVLLAILLHQPLDTLSITTLMVQGGWSRKSQLLVNAVFAALCPLGALLFLMGVSQLQSSATDVVGYSLGLSAGVFLCISLADLLPEMEFHSHHRLSLSAMLLLGILLAWGIRFLEPRHLHNL